MPEHNLTLSGNFNEAQGERLVLITPDPTQYAMTHEILLHHEAVHPMRDLQELLHNRLGYLNHGNPFQPGSTSSKLAFALVEEPFTRAVIYVDLSQHPTQGGHIVAFPDMPGDLNAILNKPSNILTVDFNTFCFYSVSNISNANDPQGRGAGERLITQLHALLRPQGYVMTTLSPFRGFRTWIENKGLKTDEIKKGNLVPLALERVFEHDDRVQKFHLSNGAVIGGFHNDVNGAETRDAVEGMNIAVNYVYPHNVGVLQHNAAAYRLRKIIPIAEHLYAQLNTAQKASAQRITAAETQKNTGFHPHTTVDEPAQLVM